MYWTSQEWRGEIRQMEKTGDQKSMKEILKELEKCDRKKFSTMLICYTILMVGWYVGAFAPLILLKDMYIASLPTMAEFNTQVFNLVAGPLFFVALAETAVGGIAGSFLGKAILKKHFQKAGIV